MKTRSDEGIEREGPGSIRERWRIYFSGNVQHVGFRYTAFYLARELYLTGWVNNLSDGRVVMEVQGEVSRIRRLILRLKSKPHIRIYGMEIQKIAMDPLSRKFEVRGYD